MGFVLMGLIGLPVYVVGGVVLAVLAWAEDLRGGWRLRRGRA